MWYAAHLATPLADTFTTTSLFMSLCTSLDRLYALLKPFSYKTANHKRHRIAAFSISLSLSVSICAFDCFRFQLTQENGVYSLIVDEIYTASTAADVFEQLRNVVQSVGKHSNVIASISLALPVILLV